MRSPYDRIGIGCRRTRRSDPRIVARIEEALDDAESVVNVGAGTGSYEPRYRRVVAVEPSITMIRQRQPTPALVVRGVAENAPPGALALEALGLGLDPLRRLLTSLPMVVAAHGF